MMKTLMILLLLGLSGAGLYEFGYKRLPASRPTAAAGPENARREINQQTSKKIRDGIKINAPAMLSAAQQLEAGNHQAFDQQVYELGASLNKQIESSLKLSPAAKNEMDNLLATNYPDIAKSARENYLAQIDTIKAVDQTTKSTLTYTTRADILASSINSTACSFANLIFIPMGLHFSLSTNIAASYFMQAPCEILLAGVMEPVGDALHRTGMVKDIEITQTRLSLDKESMLTEMATAQMDIRVAASKVITRSIDVGKWNLSKWEAASLKVDYAITVKYGYDLSKVFNITRDDHNRVIHVYLPDCEMTEIKLDPVHTDVNSGMFAEISNAHCRQIYEQAQAEAVRVAEQRGIRLKARSAMEVILGYIFMPYTSDHRYPYQLKFEYEPANIKQHES